MVANNGADAHSAWPGITGKRVLVTAAGNGIGRATALLFADAEAVVFGTDVSGASLAGLTDVHTDAVDGSDPDAVATYLKEREAFDAVVHCVGIVPEGTILDCDGSTWERAFRTNVDSFFFLLQQVLPPMVQAGGGSIICISSVASSLKGFPNRAAYGATKAALVGMVKSVAADFAGDNIRSNAVCPGTIRSPSLERRMALMDETSEAPGSALQKFVGRQPLGRLGTPEEVAGLCLYLASDYGRFVTGQTIAIDGGITI